MRSSLILAVLLLAGCTSTLTGLNANNELREQNAELRKTLAAMTQAASWQQLAASGSVQVVNPERRGRVAMGLAAYGEFEDRLISIQSNGNLSYAGTATSQPAGPAAGPGEVEGKRSNGKQGQNVRA